MPRILALAVLLAAIAFAASPLLTSGFNGFTPAQFPIPQDRPPVQPAGIAFSIWSVIYAWLIAGAAYGLWKAADDPDWHAMRPWLFASLALGSLWLPVAQRAPVPATVLIVVMLVTAIAALLQAGSHKPLWQTRPVGLYAGWLTAATGVSFGLLLAGYGWLNQTPAAVVALVLVLLTGLAVQAMRPRDWAYPAALIWALAWVAVVNVGRLNPAVLLIAVLGIALLGWRLWAGRRT